MRVSQTEAILEQAVRHVSGKVLGRRPRGSENVYVSQTHENGMFFVVLNGWWF